MRRLIILFLLAALVALPFLLRPKEGGGGRTDDTVVIVTPNNEAIRHEFALGFKAWYLAKTGRTVTVDWRVLGGTSEIARLLRGQYIAAFQNYWVNQRGQPWSSDVQAGFLDNAPGPAASAAAKAARAAFLASDVGCGIDVFFGGGNFDFARQADLGTLVDSGIARLHPDWFTDTGIPAAYDGNLYRDPQDRWFGCVMSSYGIIYNRDAVGRLGFAAPPGRWEDLADPRYVGQIGLCDPTKSGSIAMAFENVIQQQMHRRLAAGAGKPAKKEKPPTADEAAAVRQGWIDGLQLLQRIGANARYFTDSSQKPPIDVADGNCAAGMCIDFYGRQQADAVQRRADSDRLGFVSPPGGTAYSVDPIGLMRGAPNRAVGVAFLEYVLSLDGQKLWCFKPGTPGGPRDFALGRLPVRRDFYLHEEWKPLRGDPDAHPFTGPDQLVYRPEWTSGLFRQMAFIVRVMCQDTHDELAEAWRATNAAPEPAHSRALAILQDMSDVTYERAAGAITTALTSKNQVDEVHLARELAASFRERYARAEAVAKGR
jgi:iron(III) transport system substrate-binding protein